MVNLDFVFSEHFQFWKSDFKVEKSHFVQVCMLEPQFAVFYQLIILQRLSIPWIPKHRVARPFLPFPTIQQNNKMLYFALWAFGFLITKHT
jgi:hypothetical protein